MHPIMASNFLQPECCLLFFSSYSIHRYVCRFGFYVSGLVFLTTLFVFFCFELLNSMNVSIFKMLCLALES